MVWLPHVVGDYQHWVLVPGKSWKLMIQPHKVAIFNRKHDELNTWILRMPNISKHIFRNQRDHSHLDARLQWGHFCPQLAMFPMAAMAHPQWWPWEKHITMTSHGEVVLLVGSFKPMPETYSSAIIMDHSLSICSERIFMEYQQGIIPKTMDHLYIFIYLCLVSSEYILYIPFMFFLKPPWNHHSACLFLFP